MVQHMSPFMLHLWILELLQLPSGAIWNFRWMYSSKKPTKDVSWRHVSEDATMQHTCCSNGLLQMQQIGFSKTFGNQKSQCDSALDVPHLSIFPHHTSFSHGSLRKELLSHINDIVACQMLPKQAFTPQFSKTGRSGRIGYVTSEGPLVLGYVWTLLIQ